MWYYGVAIESARQFVEENYHVCGVLFVVLALVLAGKFRVALAVAVSAGAVYWLHAALVMQRFPIAVGSIIRLVRDAFQA